MDFPLFLASLLPIFYSLYWLALFLRIIRKGQSPGAFALLGGLVLYAIGIILTFASREALITENATQSPLGEYLLSTSFFADSLERYAVQFLAAAASALILWLVLLGLRRISQRNFYDVREAGMVAVAALIAGWPGVFVFLALLFIVVLLGGVIRILIGKGTIADRFIIGPMIPVAAIGVVWFGNYLVGLVGLEVIRF